MAEKFNQKEYIKEYQRENRIAKKVTFNRKNPDDMKLVEWLDNRPEGIVQYLKTLIREDMVRDNEHSWYVEDENRTRN